MKRLLFLSILSLFSFQLLVAQGELDDFDFFEQEDSDDEYSKKKDGGGQSKKKKIKSLLGGYAYYHIPGNMTLGAGFYALKTPRSVAIPNPIDFEITALKNVSIGLRYTYFRYKTYEALDSTTMTATSWLSREKWIGDRTFAGMLTIHISQFIGVDPDKFDVYVRGFVGKNNVKADWTVVDVSQSSLLTTVVVVGGGIRYLYNDLISLYVDAGYSRYGIINFGINYRIWNLQF